MSGVDVLAVMDEAIEDCEWLIKNSTKTMEVSPSQLREARAAVAELIEKSSRLASVVTFRIDDDRAAMLDDLYAALARVSPPLTAEQMRQGSETGERA